MSWLDNAYDDASIVVRLVGALVFAGIIGWQREATDRAAGLRTHMLIGMSAALFVILGDTLVQRYAEAPPAVRELDLKFDPLRTIEAVVAGISFLGAGTIFVARGKEVKGLTTAAGMFATAGMGVAVALERYLLAAGVTALCLVVLALMHWVEAAATKGAKAPDAESD